MSRALVIALFAIGCGRQLNPEYCAGHPDDVDCRTHDLVMIDAPVGCTQVGCGDPMRPVCEVSTGNCVQCLPGGDPMQCPADNVCGQDRACHACIVDTDCQSSKVCLASGTCADVGQVLYASPMGTGDCSIATPCTFSQAVAAMTAARNIVKLTTTAGTDYTDAPIVLPIGGTIIGTGTTFTPTGAGAAISMTKLGPVEILGITIQSASTQGILCSETKLAVRRATIIGSGGYGIQTTKCDAEIERCTFMRNVGGGIFINDGTFEVRNNIIGPGNGSDTLTQGNIQLVKGKGRVVFNTVARNKSENGGGDRFSAMKCSGSAMFLVAHNIFTSNGSANAAYGGDCKYLSNFVDGNGFDIDDVKFVNKDSDFRLTMASPTSNPTVREDPDADADCHRLNAPTPTYIDDIEGQARPNGLCDRGADEWRP